MDTNGEDTRYGISKQDNRQIGRAVTAGRQYARLRMDIWRDDDWRQLTADAQWLYKLLISQPTITTAGVLPLQIAKWTRCAADMTGERIVAALGLLIERRYIVVDDDTEEVLVRTFIRHDVVAQGSGLIMLAALTAATAVQSEDLRAVLLQEIRRFDRDWTPKHKNAINTLEESLSKGSRKPSESHSKGSVVVVVGSEVVSNNFTPPGNLLLPESGTSPARARDRNGRPTMDISRLCGNEPAPSRPPPEDRRVSMQARDLVKAAMPDLMWRSGRQTRRDLELQVDLLLADDADPDVLTTAVEALVGQMAVGEDKYPGHLKHVYARKLAEQTATPQQIRNGQPMATGDKRFLAAQGLKRDPFATPPRKELT